MAKINIENMKWKNGTFYPSPFNETVEGRYRKRLGVEAGLNQFGVNLTKLDPGAQSALRHWHENEDELVYIVSGEVILVEDEGETLLKAGDAAGWKAGEDNGHHLINRSNNPATYIEIGTRAPKERAHYPDDDLLYESDAGFTHKDGSPYEENSQ